MSLQRVIGILILLSITLLIIPRLYQSNVQIELMNKSVESQDITVIDIEVNNENTFVTAPEPKVEVKSTLITKPIPENKYLPLTSIILDDATKLDIPQLIMPDLPVSKLKVNKKSSKQKRTKLPIFTTVTDGVWRVKIVSLKASEPFAISGFKQVLAKHKIKYTASNHIINKTKWVRFSSLPVVSKKVAVQLKNHINGLLSSKYQINASVVKSD